MDDCVLPFQLAGLNVRGRLARLGTAADTIIRQHGYPSAVSQVLGESLALTAVLGSMLKFDGVFILQAQSKGPISLMVVDFETGGRLRGYVRYDEDRLGRALAAADAGKGRSLGQLFGAGHMAFTVDQGADTERYQGIVALEGASIADCAHNYFRQSEQLETAIKLWASPPRDGGAWRAGGIMVQRLPGNPAGLDDETDEDGWRRAVALMSSTRAEELVDPALSGEALLYRLFHEDGVRVHDRLALRAGCRCNRQRVEEVLKSFPREDLADMVEQGRITVTCEFCSTAYVFADTDVLPSV